MNSKKLVIRIGCKAIVAAAFVAINMVFGATAGEVVATAVTAQQRYPWNGKVDIAVTITGASNDVAQAVCTFAATNSATHAMLNVSHLTEDGTMSGSDSIWTRRFIWDATADVGEVGIEDVVLTVEVKMPLGGVQLWEGGPYWAECNVGAKNPEDYGYYFWWGDTVGYSRSGGSFDANWPKYTNVKWVSSTGAKMSSSPFTSSTCPTYNKTILDLQTAGYIDSSGNLAAAHDAATAHFGAPWRMPTDVEFSALINNCTTTWKTRNGVYGRLVTGKGAYASKSIFLPAAGYGYEFNLSNPGRAGYYYSSTPLSGASYNALCLLLGKDREFYKSSSSYYTGHPVRPIREFAKSSSTTHLALDCRAGARLAGMTEPIRFSPAWETAVDGATATVTMDGTPVTNATEAGAFEWTPMRNGSYSFVHIVSVDGTPIGESLSATFVVEWFVSETPVISAASAAFDGASQEVTISCATEGATVYYTIDGSEPSAANGRVYKGPFNIYDSVTVKAIAVKDDWKDSVVASAAFTKNNGLSAAINMYDYLPDNDADCPWTVATDVSHDGVSSARSGAIGENGVTTMKVTVRGAGRLSFWWKSECEEWDEDYYDYGAFCVGSETEPRLRIAGMTDWRREEIVFDGTGKHICKWEYHKDDAETIPRDCIWVDQVQWLPYGESEHDHTLTTEVPVPYLWLDSYGLGRETDFETAAKMKFGKVDGAGRAMSVEDDYVAGTDPTNLASKLTATIKIGAGGKPIVSWKPPLNGEDADGAGIREGVRSYSVYGKQALDDAEEEWTPVAEGDEGNYRFFKVSVEMR